VSFKIIMTTSVTRPCFTAQHQTRKTKTDFFGLRPVLSQTTSLILDDVKLAELSNNSFNERM